MNGWFLIVWIGFMLVWGAIGIGTAVTGWQPSGQYASSHDDPSPGPNSLF